MPWRRDRLPTPIFLGFPGGSVGKNPPAMWRPGFDPWVGKIPLEKGTATTPVFWPGEFHGLYSPWGHKESDVTMLITQLVKNPPTMQETPVQFLGQEDLLEKG